MAISSDARQVLLGMRDLSRLIPMSPSALYRMSADGRFPRPIRLGGEKSGYRWKIEAVNKWLFEHGLPQIVLIQAQQKKGAARHDA